MSPMGGSRSTTWRDTLEGLDLPIEARIAREAIQNSADATLTGEKTEVLVWDKPLTAEEEFRFRDILDLDSQGSLAFRLDQVPWVMTFTITTCYPNRFMAKPNITASIAAQIF